MCKGIKSERIFAKRLWTKTINIKKQSGGGEKKPMIGNDQYLIPPDGKYGWIIVLSYAIANVSTQDKSKIISNVEFFKILIQ